MRILHARPDAVDPDLYRRFVQRAQIEALMPDLLVEGEPYLAPNAVVLDPGESAQLRKLTSAFAAAFRRAGEIVMTDRALMEDWGFPWLAAELLAAEVARMQVVGRFDFLPDADGSWRLLEFNADTPSGIREAIAVDAIVHRMIPGASVFERPNRLLRGALVKAFEHAITNTPTRRRRLGLVTDAGELEDLSQM